MIFKRIVSLVLTLALMLTAGTAAMGAAKVTDTVKYKTVKLAYGAEFSIPSDWKQTDKPNETIFIKPADPNGYYYVNTITVMSSKQDKVKYKDLNAFTNKMEEGFHTSFKEKINSKKIKASYASGDITDTTYVISVDLGGEGGIGKLETAYFKTKTGYYFGIRLVTTDVNINDNKSRYDNVIPKLIASFKEIKPFTVKTAAKPAVKSSRLFPVSMNGEFSYVNVDGKVVFKTPYGFADDFVGGYAHIMNELGGMSGYIDTKGKQLPGTTSVKNTSKANLNLRGAREIKGDTVVDLSKKVKKYTSTHDGWKAVNEDYNIGDGFEVRTWTASGAPCTRLYKNGKILCENNPQLKGNDIFLIVKYDNEKIIRFLYADLSTGKLKTLYVDYNGNPIWTKTAQLQPVPTAKPPVSKGTEGMQIDDFFSDTEHPYFYVGYNLDSTYQEKAGKAVELVNAAILKRTGGSLTDAQKTELITELKKGKELKSTSYVYTVNNQRISISLYHNTDPSQKHLKDINVNVTPGE